MLVYQRVNNLLQLTPISLGFMVDIYLYLMGVITSLYIRFSIAILGPNLEVPNQKKIAYVRAKCDGISPQTGWCFQPL